MVICLKANLSDAPGELIQMLKPISDNTGNILSVIHTHNGGVKSKIPVVVQFSLAEEIREEKLKTIIKELEDLSIEITEVSHVKRWVHLQAIISGHVFATDFIDTYRRISEKGGTITELEAKFTGLDNISNVKFHIRCESFNVASTLDELKKICAEKNFTMITDRQ